MDPAAAATLWPCPPAPWLTSPRRFSTGRVGSTAGPVRQPDPRRIPARLRPPGEPGREDQGRWSLTSRASRKASWLAVGHLAFVGGHPMAGSEQDGVEGADPTCSWGHMGPHADQHTSGDAYSEAQALVAAPWGQPGRVRPRRHDELVALVSHTPHLTAATLMNLAADEAASDAVLLRLAAGGFRDMTRVAAGHPGIWPTSWPRTRRPYSRPLTA